ncbi:ABC transporter ATP-binding protein [Leucobacter sp. Z1108]|uniref:ABC transporter ATP-binding protein n=1 Tax=Leucobacter sp. Z1108 TaxID=3439066 RepID=UPI003F419DE0
MPPLHEASDEAPVVIKADRVSKHFMLRRDNSLKDRLLSFRTGRQNREEFTALDDVSVEVKAGHTVALIGHNGSGKSTLLKIIGGILDPSSGMISSRGRIAALLELGAGFHPDLSGRDNVFLNASLLGMSRAETDAVFDDIVAFAELEDFIDTQVKFYSSGMYVRLAFAVAIHTDPDILLVDEVLAVGDEAFQRKCMDAIRRFQADGGTILLVTHNLGQVLELSDSAVLLHHGELVYQGDPREAVTRFRDLLEERRVKHEHEVSESREDLSGPQTEIGIQAYCVAEHREANEPVDLGDDLNIHIDLQGQVLDDDWMLSIQIDNPMGLRVFGAANDLIEMPLSPFSGSVSFRFTIQNTCFGEGKYFVNVSVLDGGGQHLKDATQAASFNVIAPRTSRGAISMKYSLEKTS